MTPVDHEILASLRKALPLRERRHLERQERAAVLVPVVDDGGEARLLLTRRADSLPTHRGQVAFPGGHVGPEDDDPGKTALREASEEIGLPPERVEILGWLGDLTTREGTVAVTPVVGLIGSLPPLRPRPEEVARIFSIPLRDLVVPERWKAREEDFRGRAIRLQFFEHEGEILWGLSARVVLELLKLTPRWPPLAGLL